MFTTFASLAVAAVLTMGGVAPAPEVTPGDSSSPSPSVSATSNDPNSIVASDCDPATDQTCKTAYDDFWAKDAYDTFKDPLNGMSDQDIKDAFTATYYGTYTTAPDWGDGYAVVPSKNYDGVFHVFVVVPGNPVDSTVTDAADSAVGE